MPNSENNKRIAKNTILLYLRMILAMGVSLYTSRVVLNILGAYDFGIYNVVSGVVIMFSFLSSSMFSATQRFLSFELGKKNSEQLKKVFSMSLNIHAVIAISIFLLAETIGLWLLNAKLVIPYERLEAANWVYQLSILSFMLTVISMPYNAAIIAHERMNVYAYVSIVDVSLKLLMVFMIQFIDYDKLKSYAVLIFFISLFTPFTYGVYCNRHFPESKYHFFRDKLLFRTLRNYAVWNLWGNAAGVIYGQGINILLNIFFGPAINTARAIAFQVQGAVNGIVSNFQMSMNPQIVKSYAANDIKYMHQIIFHGSRYSFFLLFILSLPILLETEIILNLWLKNVPEYTVIFTRLALINVQIDCISGPLMTAAQASGSIKIYQSVVGGLLLLILPIAYLFLELGFPPQVTIYVSILISIIALFARLWILQPLMDISIRKFIKEIILISLLIAVVAIIAPMFVRLKMDEGPIRFLIVSIMAVCSSAASIYIFGLNSQEKHFLFAHLNKYFFSN